MRVVKRRGYRVVARTIEVDQPGAIEIITSV
jgi:hypothetical protein